MTMRRLHGEKPQPLDWVMVANAARARCFERDPENGALREIAGFVHPASRQKGSELEHDRGGMARKSGASTQFAPHTGAHDKQLGLFARELATHLDEAALAHRFGQLVVVASTPFAGHLRAALGASARRLAAMVPLDLSSFRGAELEGRVTQALQEAGAVQPAA